MLGIELVLNVVRKGGSRWMGHVSRKNESNWVRRAKDIDVTADPTKAKDNMD